jgi:hypothetical protein
MRNIFNWMRLAGTIGINIYCFLGIINHHLHLPTLSMRTSGTDFISLTAIIILFLASLILTGAAIYGFSYVPKGNGPIRLTDLRVWFGLSFLALLGTALIIEGYISMGIIKLP